MKIQLSVSGMACAHCAARLKAALEAQAGVLSAETSHEAGQAVVTYNEAKTDETAIRQTVEDAGFDLN